jgi:DNA primase
MIPQETVQHILQAADVAEVIGDFVSLKKRGSNLIACCPFHNEKTPSFSVSPSKGIYKCFGCGKGGDAVRFLMDLEGLSYPEALKWLAKKYGIEIIEKEFTDEELLAQNERDSLFIVNEFAAEFYANQLKEEEGESIGLSYFKERGFNEATISKFKLGYSPDAWDVFTRHALKQGYRLEILEKAGLTIIREGKEPIDRFRGRVIFPIINVAGKPVAFGARILKTDPKSPKYLNSPETEIYHKSRLVYGIYTAKQSIRQKEVCYLVEGYTDVVSLAQAGIENVVASSGTSLTVEQIQLIRRFTTNITMLYDGDKAGINASLRGTDLILEEGMDVRVVVFPDGEDPDSYIKKVGGDAFEIYIKENQKDFIRFKTEHSLSTIGNDAIARASLISELVDTITKIPDAIKRAVFYREVAKLLEVDEAVLVEKGNTLVRNRIKDKNKPKEANEELPVYFQEKEAVTREIVENLQLTSSANSLYEEKYIHEAEILRYLIKYACYSPDANAEEIQKNHGIIFKVWDNYSEYITFDSELAREGVGLILEAIENNEPIYISDFIGHKEELIRTHAINWIAPRYLLSEGWKKYEIFIPTEKDKLEPLFEKAIQRSIKNLFRISRELEARKLDLNLSEEEEDQIQLKIQGLKKEESGIAAQLGSVI